MATCNSSMEISDQYILGIIFLDLEKTCKFINYVIACIC